MQIVAILSLVVCVLWLWLVAHWFGRVLAFLALLLPGLFVVYALADNTGMGFGHLLATVIIGASSWGIANIPMAIAARRSRRNISLGARYTDIVPY